MSFLSLETGVKSSHPRFKHYSPTFGEWYPSLVLVRRRVILSPWSLPWVKTKSVSSPRSRSWVETRSVSSLGSRPLVKTRSVSSLVTRSCATPNTQPTTGRPPSGRRPGVLGGKRCRQHGRRSSPNYPAFWGGAEGCGCGRPPVKPGSWAKMT